MIITRFAPSPTGYLHLGHAYSAVLNFRAGDRFILRIEDIDQTRCRPEFYDAIYADLAWLGIQWEEPVLVQTTQMARYNAVLEDLRARGLLYRCFKSRKDIEEMMSAPHAAPGQAFVGEALPAEEEATRVATGEPYAWRLSMAAALAEVDSLSFLRKQESPSAAERDSCFRRNDKTLSYFEETADGVMWRKANPESFGDVVLGRKESGTSYHLASVLDDALQGITHVIRGEELREAAGLHVLLQRLLGLPSPVYRHHRMLTNTAGERLSKRDGALALRAMRAQGMAPGDVLTQLGMM